MAGDARGPICPELEAVNLQCNNVAPAASACAWPIRCLTLLQFLLDLPRLSAPLWGAGTGLCGLEVCGQPAQVAHPVCPRGVTPSVGTQQ